MGQKLMFGLIFTAANLSNMSWGMPSAYTHFETSCQMSVRDAFDQATGLLYLFEYPRAFSGFESIIAQDSQCCLAYFMAGSTFIHPIWDFIDDKSLLVAEKYANQALACASTNNQTTTRERLYISALLVYTNTTNPSVVDPAKRLQAYASAMFKVFSTFGQEDENAAILYGLSSLAVGYYSESEPMDGWPHLKEAARVERIAALQNPRSSGAFHYIVHALDQPALASNALSAAQQLQIVDGTVPHAIHMPSHIYSDRGLWNLSVAANAQSLSVAFAQGNYTLDWFHGAYFLQVAMLQVAMDCDARAFLDDFRYRLRPLLKNQFLMHGESILRVVGHFIIETRAWADAAAFNLDEFYDTTGDTSVWDKQQYTRIYASFIATAGKAVLNHPAADIVQACNALETANRSLYANPDWRRRQMPYWRTGFDVMVKSARAWKTFRLVSMVAGIAAMEEVADFQIRSWAPEAGHMWDANEQLAEMYIIRSNSNQSTDDDIPMALKAYERARAIYPKRYHSVAGAATASAMLQDTAKACVYYRELIDNTAPSSLPIVAVDGVPQSKCPRYLSARRPALQAAFSYVEHNCTPGLASGL